MQTSGRFASPTHLMGVYNEMIVLQDNEKCFTYLNQNMSALFTSLSCFFLLLYNPVIFYDIVAFSFKFISFLFFPLYNIIYFFLVFSPDLSYPILSFLFLFFSVPISYHLSLSYTTNPTIPYLSYPISMGQLFKTFNLDQNDPDLEIPLFPIQDHVIRFTFMPVFQSIIGLDHPDPDTQFSRLPVL